MTTIDRKTEICEALQRFIRQRPGLEFGNYGDVTSYRAEVRTIGRSLQHAEYLLGAIRWRDSITADCLIDAAKHSFSGRLSIVESADGRVSIDYCTGQYWPTEYRRAVCNVLASALWDYWRTNGGKPRETARKELPRSIASAYFN